MSMQFVRIENALVEGYPESGRARVADPDRKLGYRNAHCQHLYNEGCFHAGVVDGAGRRLGITFPFRFLGMGEHRDVLELDNSNGNFKLLDSGSAENYQYVAKISWEGDRGLQQPDYDLLHGFQRDYHGVLARFFPKCVAYFHQGVRVKGPTTGNVSMLITTRASGDSVAKTVKRCLLDMDQLHDAVMAVCCGLIFVMEVQICTADATGGRHFVKDLHAENVTVAKKRDVRRIYDEFCCVDPSGFGGLLQKTIAATTVQTFCTLLVKNKQTEGFGQLLSDSLQQPIRELNGQWNYKDCLQRIQDSVVKVVVNAAEGKTRVARYLTQDHAMQLQNLLVSIRRGDTPYSCERRPSPADATHPSMAGNVTVRTAPVRSGHGIVPPNSHGIVPNSQPPQPPAAAARRLGFESAVSVSERVNNIDGRMAPPEPMTRPPWERSQNSPQSHPEGMAAPESRPRGGRSEKSPQPQWTRPPRLGKETRQAGCVPETGGSSNAMTEQAVWQRPQSRGWAPAQESEEPPPPVWVIHRNVRGNTKTSGSDSGRHSVPDGQAGQKVAEVPEPTTTQTAPPESKPPVKMEATRRDDVVSGAVAVPDPGPAPPESMPPVKMEATGCDDVVSGAVAFPDPGPAVPKPANMAARKGAPNKYVAEPDRLPGPIAEDAALESPGNGSLLDSITKEEPTEEFDSEEPKASSASSASSASESSSSSSSHQDQVQDAAAASSAPEQPGGGGTKRAWADTYDDDQSQATLTQTRQTGNSSDVAVLSPREQNDCKQQLLDEYQYATMEGGTRCGRTDLVFQDPAQNAKPLPSGAAYDPNYWRTREDSRAQMMLLHQLLRCVCNLLEEAIASDPKLRSHAHLKDFNKFKGNRRIKWLWYRLRNSGVEWMDSKAPASKWPYWATHPQLREAVEWFLWDLLPTGWVQQGSEAHKVFLVGPVTTLTSSRSKEEASIWRHRLANEIALEFGQCVLDLCNTTRFGRPPPQDGIASQQNC